MGKIIELWVFNQFKYIIRIEVMDLIYWTVKSLGSFCSKFFKFVLILIIVAVVEVVVVVVAVVVFIPVV